MSEGNLLTLDYPVGRPIELVVNGASRFTGHIVAAGRKRGILIDTTRPPPELQRTREETGLGR